MHYFFLFEAIGILCLYRFNNCIVLQGLKDCLSLYEVDNKLFIKKYVSRTNVHWLVKTFIQLSIVSNKTYENNKNFYVLWIDSCLKPYKIIDPPNSVSKSNLMSQFRCSQSQTSPILIVALYKFCLCSYSVVLHIKVRLSGSMRSSLERWTRSKLT